MKPLATGRQLGASSHHNAAAYQREGALDSGSDSSKPSQHRHMQRCQAGPTVPHPADPSLAGAETDREGTRGTAPADPVAGRQVARRWRSATRTTRTGGLISGRSGRRGGGVGGGLGGVLGVGGVEQLVAAGDVDEGLRGSSEPDQRDSRRALRSRRATPSPRESCRGGEELRADATRPRP